MPSLTKVILDLEIAIPSDQLVALSLLPHLRSLELRQARMDGPSLSLSQASFALLTTLVISIWVISPFLRTRSVDQKREFDNVVALLQAVSGSLTTLSISGDLLSPESLTIKWPYLRNFSVTEHTPTPYLLVPELISRMPELRQLSVLFTADSTRDVGELHPPFTVGVRGGEILTNSSPHLHSVTLSNVEPSDPIFQQLPCTLDALRIVAAEDLYIPLPAAPYRRKWAPLTPTMTLTILKGISHFVDLAELTLTLAYFAPPTLIDDIATAFPRLHTLELERAAYTRARFYREDVRDSALLVPLARLLWLRRLRISLDFYERVEFYSDNQPLFL
ncbi:hypothetical protein GGX14DRAFT_605630 [Mycena pura]|uniref:F-box domain-containing protein n=1 Tax=Mycena pura TaxID=153505 RepID=A0AAD6YIQ5_9AGAR|nr:hypothetical protein GGX14DRAFT_605630 [Mycena pura]